MAYRDDARSKSSRARTFEYRPRPRPRWRIALDLAFLGVSVWLIQHYARHWELRCAWEGHLASCTTTTESAFGHRQTQTFGGIRSASFQSGTRVGFVTDMANRDPEASFGTREVVLPTEQDAVELRDFADDRIPSAVAYADGVAHPLHVTVLGLLGLFVFAVLTRTRRVRVTVDPGEGLLLLRRGPFDTERIELAKVKRFEVENAEAGLHRVWLRAEGGDRPLSANFLRGAHHHAFVDDVNAGLEAVRAPRAT